MGLQFPFAALLPAILLVSCAGGQAQPALDLLKTEWLLEDLGGKGVVDRAQATLAFPEPNKVVGNGSCNRFFGPVEIKGDTIHFGLLASTRRACVAAALSEQEANYLGALQHADHFSLEGPYLLIHSQSLEKPLRFTRITRKSQP